MPLNACPLTLTLTKPRCFTLDPTLMLRTLLLLFPEEAALFTLDPRLYTALLQWAPAFSCSLMLTEEAALFYAGSEADAEDISFLLFHGSRVVSTLDPMVPPCWACPLTMTDEAALYYAGSEVYQRTTKLDAETLYFPYPFRSSKPQLSVPFSYSVERKTYRMASGLGGRGTVQHAAPMDHFAVIHGIDDMHTRNAMGRQKTWESSDLAGNDAEGDAATILTAASKIACAPSWSRLVSSTSSNSLAITYEACAPFQNVVPPPDLERFDSAMGAILEAHRMMSDTIVCDDLAVNNMAGHTTAVRTLTSINRRRDNLPITTSSTDMLVEVVDGYSVKLVAKRERRVDACVRDMRLIASNTEIKR
ncbi:hypothetical protein DE146DRAFT_637778 [Phaeosphaeria sp. MPI-PUGE-AT-0046c]|nr:hypothetical protein DE146DRAFT_637778 [Phaeosphaeria sp. MPI-PUGE-AT-0046c]